MTGQSARPPGAAWAVKDLAAAWGCSTSAIYAMIDEGALHTFTIGRKRGIRITDEEKRRCESANRKAIETETSLSASETVPPLPTTAMKMVSAGARG